MARYDYLIVGGGMTADAAARGIRERDAKGSIGIVGADPHPPYNRPPLTKGLWKTDAPDSVWRKTEEAEVDLHLGRRVQTIDAAGRRVIGRSRRDLRVPPALARHRGRAAPPPRRPRRGDLPPDPGRLPRHPAARRPGAGFVVLGGGFIGAEIAAALRMHGRDVTMIVPGQGLGGRVFPAELSRFLVEYYRERGVRMEVGESAERVERRDGRFVVHAQRSGAIGGRRGDRRPRHRPRASSSPGRPGSRSRTGSRSTSGFAPADPRSTPPGTWRSSSIPPWGSACAWSTRTTPTPWGRWPARTWPGPTSGTTTCPSSTRISSTWGTRPWETLDARHQTVVDWKEEFREGVIYYLDGGRVRGVLLWNTWGQVDAARELIAAARPVPGRAAEGPAAGRLARGGTTGRGASRRTSAASAAASGETTRPDG